MKPSEENIGINLHNLKISNDFLYMTIAYHDTKT